MTVPRSELLVYRTGDATAPFGEGPKIIAHVCNDVGRWGKGFVLAVSERWPQPEQQYRRWWRERQTTFLPLGDVQLVGVGERLWVANMIGQHGVYGTDGRPPIRYEALRACLKRVRESAIMFSASVHMPRIGCGLAGGTWSKVASIIIEQLCDHGVSVIVYDLLNPRPVAGHRTTSARGRY